MPYSSKCHLSDLLCYARRMTRETKALLDAFETLPETERRVFADEIIRRLLPFDSGPISDEEIGAASSELFKLLDVEDASADSR